MCGKGKRCEKKGGMCFRKKDAPGNAEPLGKKGCKGKCSCYKIPETTTPEMTSKILINSKDTTGANSENAKVSLTKFVRVKFILVSHGHRWMFGQKVFVISQEKQQNETIPFCRIQHSMYS